MARTIRSSFLSSISAVLAISTMAGCANRTGSDDTAASTSDLVSTVDATFEVDCVPTQFGQNVYVVGNVPELGSWDPARAVALEGIFGGWGDDRLFSKHFVYSWIANVKLQAGQDVEFKFIILDENKQVTWESGTNRAEAVGGHDIPYTPLSYYAAGHTIYTYADYWNRDNGNACPFEYWQYVQDLNSLNSQ